VMIAAQGGCVVRMKQRLWFAYLGAVVTMVGLYFLLPRLGEIGGAFQMIAYDAVTLSSFVAIVVGIRLQRSRRKWPWLLLAAGQLGTAVGDVTYDVLHALLHVEADVTISDMWYLAAYPLLAAGLMRLVRHRTPGWDAPGIIDAGIIAISAGLLSWMFLISPTAFAADTSALARAVGTAYPVLDLLLLSVAARLMLGAGTRTASFRLLTTGLLLLLVADTVYDLQNLLGVYQDGSWLDACWMLAAASLGAAALHPSMREVTEVSPAAGPDATPGRLVLLAVAALLAPATMLMQYLRGATLYLPIATSACMALFLLVIGRMAVMVAAQRHMAITDALTGLRTRRFLEQALTTEAARHQRHVGLLLLDVDHFKSVNDTHGHHGGDRVLCEIARRLQELVRPGDVVARYGGEEFAVLLPGATGAELARVGERVRRGIANTPVAVDREALVTITVSIGAAVLPDHVDSAADLTLTADRALYAAKESGRNRLITAQPVAA
jgi:two-component system cell cycle response regulator